MTKELKERPILFNGAMVRAVLSGGKTQTRRVIKSPAKNMQKSGQEVIKRNPDNDPWYKDRIWSMRTRRGMWGDYTHEQFLEFCPYGQVGDQLWVREAFGDSGVRLVYRADSDDGASCMVKRWVPSIHMPRKASRIQLEITGVRVERLNDCSEADALAEGVEPNWCGDLSKGPNGFGSEGWIPDNGWIHYLHGEEGPEAYTPLESYQSLWESINGEGSWAANPWVWVVEFKVIKP